jgi:hypothetical protein
LEVGDQVEILGPSEDQWTGGFEIASVLPGMGCVRYRLRRSSDGFELPRLFTEVAPTSV